MALAEEVLAGQLMRSDGPLGEGEAGDIEIHRELLVLPRQPCRLVVAASIVGVVEGELAAGTDPGAEIENPAPEHAVTRRGTAAFIQGLKAAAGGHDERAGLIRPDLLAVGVGERSDVTYPLVKHRVLAPQRHPEAAIGSPTAGVGGPGVPEGADDLVDLRLAKPRQTGDVGHGRQAPGRTGQPPPFRPHDGSPIQILVRWPRC